jgi:hypothetical protein
MTHLEEREDEAKYLGKQATAVTAEQAAATAGAAATAAPAACTDILQKTARTRSSVRLSSSSGLQIIASSSVQHPLQQSPQVAEELC